MALDKRIQRPGQRGQPTSARCMSPVVGLIAGVIVLLVEQAPKVNLAMNATVRKLSLAVRGYRQIEPVSRVINGSASVRPETKRRVERAIAELTDVPNSVARGLMSSRPARSG